MKENLGGIILTWDENRDCWDRIISVVHMVSVR